MLFGTWNPEEIWHEKTYRLSTSPVKCSHCTLGTPKKSFSKVLFIHSSSDYLRYLTRKQSVIHLPTPPENVTTLTREWLNFFIWLKVCCFRFKRCRLWREPVVGCHRWLWIEPAVIYGKWNVRQAVSQQVLWMTTFCINTCFQSSSTLISRIVHHAVLKFSPCRNKPLPQASTCPYQYTRSSCSVP